MLDTVDWLGNLLPHLVTLFAILCGVVTLASGIAGAIGLSVEDVRPSAAPGATIDAVSLLNGDGLRRIVSNLVTNFTGFVPLGTVLVVCWTSAWPTARGCSPPWSRPWSWAPPVIW